MGQAPTGGRVTSYRPLLGGSPPILGGPRMRFGRSAIGIRISHQPQGWPGKAHRTFQAFKRSASCVLGWHRYIINWNAPLGEYPARCTWCGKRGPWQRVP